MKIKLKHLDAFVDRHGHERFYVRLNKVRYPLPHPGTGSRPSAEFMRRYEEILRGPPARQPMRVLEPPGLIYVAGYDRFVKIGFTYQSVAERLRSLGTGSPKPIELFFTISARPFEERLLHKRFAEYRLRGEWFELRDELLTWFDEQKSAATIPTQTERFGNAEN